MLNPKALERQRAALKAYKARFPVLVMDGDASKDAEGFRATLYGANRQPIRSDLTLVEAKAYFMERLATREEWAKECAASARPA